MICQWIWLHLKQSTFWQGPMHVVNHLCCPIWTGLQISRTAPSNFKWCKRQRARKLRSNLAKNIKVQHSSNWWPHQQYALEHYPKKAQSCALFSWSIHQVPLSTDWRSDSSSKLSHYLYTWLSICSCLIFEMFLGFWIYRLSMVAIFLHVQNTSRPLWFNPFLVFHPCMTA